MSIENLYDKVVKTYNQEISEGVLAEANQFAFNILQDKNYAFDDILALGIGDGKHVIPYKNAYPDATLSGLDISQGMLSKVKESLDCKTYHGDIAKASDIISDNKFSLIMAHFVCAYVSPDIVLKEAHELLKPEGIVSVVNNTFESFPTLWSLYEKILSKKSFLRHRMKHHVNKALTTVHAPKDMPTLKTTFEKHGFEVVEELYQPIEISLNSYKEFYEFFINGGWFLSGLVHPFVPDRVLRFLFQQLIKHHVALPYKDVLNIAVVIGKKK